MNQQNVLSIAGQKIVKAYLWSNPLTFNGQQIVGVVNC
jgi:hypothetical protein